MNRQFNLDETRSYKTVANLEKALEKLGFSGDRYLVAFTKDGRATAIFPFTNIQDGDATRYARNGFMTLG